VFRLPFFSELYDTAMKFVAHVELFIFCRVLVGALTFQNSLLSPIVYVHFLRQRYYQSQFSRDAIVNPSTRVEQIVHRPGISPMIVTIWEKGQMLVQRWAGVVLAQNGAPQ
jgi:transmembrane protein 33